MKKVLVVEDDKFLANAYRLKLTKIGFDIKMASDGKEAIEVLKTFTPDIIILDLIMPIQDGFTTLKLIKEDPNLKPIPVLITSNLGQKEDIQKGLDLGARDFMIKSDSSLDVLIQKINSIVGTE